MVMTEEERQAIIEQAMATVERLQYSQPRHNAPGEDALLRWKRGMPREEPKRERGLDTTPSNDTEQQNVDWSAWNNWCLAHIRNALHEHQEFQRELLVEIIVRTREERTRDIEQLKSNFAEQLRTLRAEIIAEIQARGGTVLSDWKNVDVRNPTRKR
jgi:hypothetical protein